MRKSKRDKMYFEERNGKYSYYLLDNAVHRDEYTLDRPMQIQFNGKLPEIPNLDFSVISRGHLFETTGIALKKEKKKVEEYLEKLFQQTEDKEIALKALHNVKLGGGTSLQTREWFDTLILKYLSLVNETTDLEMLQILISRGRDSSKQMYLDRLIMCMDATFPHIPVYIFKDCLASIKHNCGSSDPKIVKCKNWEQKLSELESKFFEQRQEQNTVDFHINKCNENYVK